MSVFGFAGGGAPIAPPPVQAPAQPLGGQPLGGQADPRSQYLAAALQALGRQPQGSAAALGENLAADALLQHAYRQSLQSNAAQGVGGGWPIKPGASDAAGPAGQFGSSGPGGSASPGGLMNLGLGALGGGSFSL